MFALLSVLLFIPPAHIRHNPPRFTWIGMPCHGKVFAGFFQRCVTWVTLQNCGLKTKCQRLEILEQWCVHCSDSISRYRAIESFLLHQTISFNVWRAIGRGVVAWVSATCGLQWGVHCTIVSINRKRFFGSSKCDTGVLFKAVLKNPSWSRGGWDNSLRQSRFTKNTPDQRNLACVGCHKSILCNDVEVSRGAFEI